MRNNHKLSDPAFKVSLAVLVIVVLAVSIKSLMLTKAPDPENGIVYTYYNNYLIFNKSFYHLLDHQNLYRYYPEEYYDLYKYSPTFAITMTPFAMIPAWAGLIFWNLLNALVLFFAFWKLPAKNQKQKLFALAFILIELVTSMQNAQSNALMAGLFIFAYISMEKERTWLAALLIVLTIYIKLFGVVALSLFIFYPKRLKTVLATVTWFIVLGLMPLLVISPSELLQQYRNWLEVLNADLSAYYGYSVMGWLQSWFGLDLPKNLVVFLGAVLLCLPLVRIKQWRNQDFRLLFLTSILIWIVIFNHMAESPTYVIAISGVAIWFFSREKMHWDNLVLIILVFIFTVLSPTDIFPSVLRDDLVKPYALKAVPCIFVWVKIQYDMYLSGAKKIFVHNP